MFVTSSNTGPGPAAYITSKEFSRNFAPKYTFGRAIDHTRPNNVPGPGAYSSKPVMGSEGTKHTIHHKPPDTDLKFGQSSPGPAAYTVSHRRSAPAFSIGRSGLDKQSVAGSSPGPNDYCPDVNCCKPVSPVWKICKSLRTIEFGKRGGPDPATYRLPGLMGKAPKAVLSGKRPREKSEDIPGPGAYNPNHKAILETYPGIVVTTGAKMERDLRTCKDDPGPGAYGVSSTLAGPRCKFGRAKKGSKSMTEFVPGPGAYKIPCTFARAERYKLPDKKLSYSFV
eukprot:TRINITY_DN2084_c0_g5_i1.p1 TRINITY_DN2084_c0_g5~~TRINITY_DN2084_c0_g5_i1.p1  ORF type:complete len:282 (+),score=22.18 TRINITY_DN2084_c0_g5_i1:608-1453(+)